MCKKNLEVLLHNDPKAPEARQAAQPAPKRKVEGNGKEAEEEVENPDQEPPPSPKQKHGKGRKVLWGVGVAVHNKCQNKERNDRA